MTASRCWQPGQRELAGALESTVAEAWMPATSQTLAAHEGDEVPLTAGEDVHRGEVSVSVSIPMVDSRHEQASGWGKKATKLDVNLGRLYGQMA